MEPKHFKPHALYQAISFALLPLCYATITHANSEQIQQLATIQVNASSVDSRYAAQNVAIQGFGTQSLKEIPASVSVVTSERMADQHAKLLTDVVKNDAAVGDAYAPIGYYPNFITRGFSLDQGSSYLINGHTVRGEQNVALENKDQIEILKGISAIQSNVSTPGGVVNYVTKRPKDIHNITLDADNYGDNTISADVGGFLGTQQQLGYRVNLAQQAIRPYVEHSNGQRSFGSVALDWNISERSQLQFDLESQRQQQRSVAGYELLDGKTVPSDINSDRLLGYQSWSKPVTMTSLNTSVKYNYKLNDDWAMSLSAAHSKVRIDDYSAFPYGFYADGTYDIYDYQKPNDARTTDELNANLTGYFQTGKLEHHLNMALTQTQKNQKQYKSINKWIGTGDIYTNTTDLSPSSASLGPYYKSLDSQQTGMSVQDLIQWNTQWSTLMGGKWLHLNEKAYNADGTENRHTQMDKFLPQMALMYRPWKNTHFYASYAKGLADGGQAPWYDENADEILAPIESIQYELGLKQQIQNFLFTAAIFDLTQQNQYSWLNIQNNKQYFIQQGKQHNLGLELSLSGDITQNLAITSSVAWTRSRLEGVDAADLMNHQTQNTPKLRAAAHLSYAIPQMEGLRLLGGVQYSARKYANKTGSVSVPSYTIFDAGLAYTFKLYSHDSTLRFNVDNLLNKKYWRDAGGYLGDDYLFLGAPRTAKLSFSFNF
ncbi:TonB-dependent siderophore receptor [Acinetobacter sp. MD2]|uniref:TonB-dependent siderophore receptor n=1 Tax=Acinetobacter sp. MD2 TaxID=2600066 RepID=UPI002D1E55A2|nr:TonB-dependent siderophore receptor [Acinetobacter sp. MD2]MEB3766425.1 TonB-dependent siderophore receptor [Acinetobacter sp. MD2]